MQREKLGSRLGFILLSAGCAIGCGNVWKFPWMAGQYGGGGFVLIYALCLIFLGLPVVVMECSLGRASQASPVRMYQKLEKTLSRRLEENPVKSAYIITADSEFETNYGKKANKRRKLYNGMIPCYYYQFFKNGDKK